jgi:hydroxymethylbilane synthase
LAAERAFLRGLDGSCETPIAGLAELKGATLRLRGEVLRPDGSEAINDDQTCPIEDAEILGTEMAIKIINNTPNNFFDWKN